MFVRRKVSRVYEFGLYQTAFKRATDDARSQWSFEHFREECDYVEPHVSLGVASVIMLICSDGMITSMSTVQDLNGVCQDGQNDF